MDKSIDTNTAGSAFNRGVDVASTTMHNAINSASDAASPALKHMASSAHSTVDKMANGANYAAAAVSTKGAQLHQLQQELAGSSRAQVRSHPLLAIGIALAGGALFSWWLSRRTVRHDASGHNGS